MKILGSILAGIIAVGYPIMVYFGLQKYGTQALAVVLLIFICIRYLLVQKSTTMLTAGSAVAVVFSITIILLDSELLLRFYPVVLNFFIAMYFFLSLWNEKTTIEVFAELSGETVTPIARKYMRVLTMCWVGILLINAAIAAYTAVFMSLAHWALYNGFLSYLFLGLFSVVEWFYRQRYKSMHRNQA